MHPPSTTEEDNTTKVPRQKSLEPTHPPSTTEEATVHPQSPEAMSTSVPQSSDDTIDRKTVIASLNKLKEIDKDMVTSIAELIRNQLQHGLNDLCEDGGDMEAFIKETVTSHTSISSPETLRETIRSIVKEEMQNLIRDVVKEEIAKMQNVTDGRSMRSGLAAAAEEEEEEEDHSDEINSAWERFHEGIENEDAQKWRKSLRRLFNDNGSKKYSLMAFCPTCKKKIVSGTRVGTGAQAT